MNIAVCLACGDILCSRHRHDYVQCRCKNESAVDGGDDYHKTAGVKIHLIHRVLTENEARDVQKIVKNNKGA